MADYKDQFTLDGKLKPVGRVVTRAKAEAADALLSKAIRGDRIAQGQLSEAFSTTDLPFNVAHLITAVTIPQFEAAERTWTQVAGVRTVNDFGPIRLQSLYNAVTGSAVHEKGGLVTVPESTPYPHITVSGQEALYSKLSKVGARFSWTWESRVNDVAGFFENIPNELLQLALDTEEREVYDALVTVSPSTWMPRRSLTVRLFRQMPRSAPRRFGRLSSSCRTSRSMAARLAVRRVTTWLFPLAPRTSSSTP